MKLRIFETCIESLIQWIEDATKTPYVNFCIIICALKNNFWRSVPSCNHMVWKTSIFFWILNFNFFIFVETLAFHRLANLALSCFTLGVILFIYLILHINDTGTIWLFVYWSIKYSSAQSKITKLNLTLVIDQNVVRFDISVHNTCFVNVSHTTENII